MLFVRVCIIVAVNLHRYRYIYSQHKTQSTLKIFSGKTYGRSRGPRGSLRSWGASISLLSSLSLLALDSRLTVSTLKENSHVSSVLAQALTRLGLENL